jgi:hypothetical protein
MLVLAALAAAAPACGRTPDLDPLLPPTSAPPTELLPVFTQTVNNDIDIVFMIDNSRSMQEEQANLRRNFPVFTAALKNLPQGLPNVHIGVVSSNLGSGRANARGCMGDGDGGRFQSEPRAQGGSCAGPRGKYIIAVGPNHNFDGDVDQAFACIAELGTSGCGFEQPLASLRQALDPDEAPPENEGFLREEAVLALILLTDEDDCSVPPDSDLLVTSSSDPRGPLSSFRCAEFGHICGDSRPPRTPAGPLTDCRSAEDGVLLNVSELAEFFKTLKADPNDVMVAAIAGPPTPYTIRLGQEGTGSGSRLVPLLAPSCTSANGSATPAVRVNEFADAFGLNGNFFSICADDFTPVMARIGDEVARRANLECLVGRAADVDGAAPGLQPHCQVFDETRTSAGTVRTLIPACDEGRGAPCWRIETAAKCAPSEQRMLVDRAGTVPPPSTRIRVICETCEKPGDRRCDP